MKLFLQGRAFHKYIKSANDDKHNADLINLVASHYEVSKLHVEEYIDVFKSTEKGTTELEELCAKYGKEPKEIKVMFLVGVSGVVRSGKNLFVIWLYQN